MPIFKFDRFAPEPAKPGALPTPNAAQTAVLLCNLGTPDAPTTAAVRTFLSEFLGDRRVVEIPRLVWWFILNGIILRFRPAKSAAKYASIWTPQGSPLRYWTEKQALLLHGHLGQRGHQVAVRAAMRYGAGSIATQLAQLKLEGFTRVLLLPAYPQYSATTTASLWDAVYAWAGNTRFIPELRFINSYASNAGYIGALANSVRKHWAANGRSELLVLSFHGIPVQAVERGDPYQAECLQTAQALALELGLGTDDYKVTFQSRLGRAQWLQPYTEPTLIALAKAGLARADVICPGFNCDGLETLEEINQEAREAFLAAGGKAFHYIPCLNDNLDWIAALADLCEQHFGGWPTRQPQSSSAARSGL